METEPVRISLKNGIKFNITAAVTDASVFHHYILKEYAPAVQGVFASSKNPAKHTLENCLYDEIAGWLDTPTITGLTILNIEVDGLAFKNVTLNHEPKISFSEVVDLLYNTYKLLSTADTRGGRCSLDQARVDEVRAKIKYLIQHTAGIKFDEPNKTETTTVGPSLR